MLKAIIFVSLIFGSYNLFAKQKFYKWTDENGVTHYTEEKPENLKINEVNVNTTQPDVATTPKIDDKTEESSETSYVEQRKKKRQLEKEDAQKKKTNCQAAKNTIKKYEQQVRMSRYNSKTGEKEYLDDSKRKEIIKKAKKKSKQYCH